MGYKSCVKCGNAAVMEWGIKCLRDMNGFLEEMDFITVIFLRELNEQIASLLRFALWNKVFLKTVGKVSCYE